jgi:hypothetical protein
MKYSHTGPGLICWVNEMSATIMSTKLFAAQTALEQTAVIPEK